MTLRTAPEHPPLSPILALDLSDGDRMVGWIDGRVLGFRGFTSEAHAGLAASIAHRTVTRRLTGRPGAGPRSTLLRPDPASPGHDTFGFEIEMPAPAEELRMRSMAHLIYRTLRTSGVRFSGALAA